MTDIPILFSAPMVQALLAGRKTQTRRLLNPQPIEPITPPLISFNHGRAEYSLGPKDRKASGDLLFRRLPIFGDRLWVKETWNTFWLSQDLEESWPTAHIPKTDPREQNEGRNHVVLDYATAGLPGTDAGKGPWRPSIFMPRWASRLTLFVTDMRIQRLHDISEADALAEGIFRRDGFILKDGREIADWSWQDEDCSFEVNGSDPVEGYRLLWDSINTDPGKQWRDNPWIYAVTFRVEQRNIDSS